MPPRRPQPFSRTFTRLPLELFRINSGWRIQLRPLKNPNFAWDIITEDALEATATTKDLSASSTSQNESDSSTPDNESPDAPAVTWRNRTVLPKALWPDTYRPPNGATLRPNSAYLREEVTRLFKGKDVVIYAVQEGTKLPDDLILVQEGLRREEYYLQPAVPMTLEELNRKITAFLYENGSMMTRSEWSRFYTKPTEPRWPTFPLPRNWRPSRDSSSKE